MLLRGTLGVSPTSYALRKGDRVPDVLSPLKLDIQRRVGASSIMISCTAITVTSVK